MVAPLFSGIATAVFVGLLLIAGGVIEGVFAFQAPSFGKGALRFLFGGLSVATGLVMLWRPGGGLGVLTMVLAAYFAATGVVDIVLAFKLRPREGWGWTGWGWTLASGRYNLGPIARCNGRTCRGP